MGVVLPAASVNFPHVQKIDCKDNKYKYLSQNRKKAQLQHAIFCPPPGFSINIFKLRGGLRTTPPPIWQKCCLNGGEAIKKGKGSVFFP